MKVERGVAEWGRGVAAGWASRPDWDDETNARIHADRDRTCDSIPALGGATPRQAAGDPVLRVDLEHLLASFPTPGPGLAIAMSADRLRAELGL